MDDEDQDQIAGLDSDRSRTFTPPSQRPTFQPWASRANTATGASSTGFQGLQRTSTEPQLRRQRSRQFSRTSVDTDSILLEKFARNNTSDSLDAEDSAQWHSISLLFVALPAVAGLFFENGSAVVTDMLMLGLACLFLYWSVKWPWQWYYSTQELKLAELDPNAEYAVFEDSDNEEAGTKSPEKSTEDLTSDQKADESDQTTQAKSRTSTRNNQKRAQAVQELQSLEIMALTSCFFSPAAVAYMLHTIRPYLSRPSGGLVSNSNLTLFVLAAELRPILHFFRLVEERTLHLQRIVTSLPASEEKQLEEQVQTMVKRLEELENRPASAGKESNGSYPEKREITKESDGEMERHVRQSLQPQLDALNRAVRRYEKRATTQAIVTEARLQDLESRLKDALSLAAAASRNSQKGGVLSSISDGITCMLTKPLEALTQVALLPFSIAGEVWRFLLGPRRVKKKGSSRDSSAKGGYYSGDFKGKQRVESR